MADRTIERVKDICSTLPECVVEGGQHHKLSVRTKTLGWHTVDHHGDGRVSLTVRAPKGDNAALVASDPNKFFLPQYVAHHGYVGVYLDVGKVDWDEIRELVTDAYRLVAPKTLVKQLDASELTYGDVVTNEFLGIIPVVPYTDIRAGHDFLVEVLGFTSGGVVEVGDGHVVHAEVRAGEQRIWLHEVGPGLSTPNQLGSGSAGIVVHVADVDAHHARAKELGANITRAPTDEDYGQREYGVKDPEGHDWYIATPFGGPAADIDEPLP